MTVHELPGVQTTTAFALARGMARAVGVEVTSAVARGSLPRARFHALVDSCQRCPVAEACMTWLSSARQEPPPTFCPNRQAFIDLGRRG